MTKRVLLLNDTSKWHCGSAAATAQIVRCIEESGGEVVARVKTGDFDAQPDFDAVDAVVVNGEGTFHDDQPWALRLLEWMCAAGEKMRVALVNAMWCRMGFDATCRMNAACMPLKIFRDERSKQAGQGTHCYPDAALMAELPEPAEKRAGVVFGVVPDQWDASYTNIKLPVPRRQPAEAWGKYLAVVGTLEQYATLEHHGLLAAMAMGTSIVPISADLYRRGWKVEGLLALHDDWTNADAVRAEMLRLRAEMLVEYPRLLREFLNA